MGSVEREGKNLLIRSHSLAILSEKNLPTTVKRIARPARQGFVTKNKPREVRECLAPVKDVPLEPNCPGFLGKIAWSYFELRRVQPSLSNDIRHASNYIRHAHRKSLGNS
jgi:hypothetical protein